MSEIKPALTTEEWAEYEGWERYDFEDDPNVIREWGRFHAMAALYLFDQPFGFTREDISLLRSVSPDHQGLGGEAGIIAKLESLADRIEALLPPEQSNE